MGSGLRLDQLHVHPHPLAAALDAALQHIAHVEIAADLADVDRLPAIGEGGVAGDDDGAGDAGKVGGQALRHAVDEILLIGAAAEVGERQDDHRKARRAGPDIWRGGVGLAGPGGGGRVDAHRPGDVLQGLFAEIGQRDVEASPHILVGRTGHADAAWRRDPLEAGGDVHPVADEVIALDQNVAEIDSHPVGEPSRFRQMFVPARGVGLHRQRASDRGDHGRKLDQKSVAHRLEHPAAVLGDDRLGRLAAFPHRRRRPRLVLAHHARIADNVGGEDCSEAARDGHASYLARPPVSFIRSAALRRAGSAGPYGQPGRKALGDDYSLPPTHPTYGLHPHHHGSHGPPSPAPTRRGGRAPRLSSPV